MRLNFCRRVPPEFLRSFLRWWWCWQCWWWNNLWCHPSMSLYDWLVVTLGGNDGFIYHLVWATVQFEVLPNLGFHICTEVFFFYIFGVWLEPGYCSFKILLCCLRKKCQVRSFTEKKFFFRLAYLDITSVAPNLGEGSFVQFSSYWNFPFILWQYFQICIPRQ